MSGGTEYVWRVTWVQGPAEDESPHGAKSTAYHDLHFPGHDSAADLSHFYYSQLDLNIT
jgi:hypothetical protein